jgi:uncharacterized ferritin-like protein (DUF455 family)
MAQRLEAQIVGSGASLEASAQFSLEHRAAPPSQVEVNASEGVPGGEPVVLLLPSMPARDTRFKLVEEAPFAEIGAPRDTAISLHTTLMSIEIVTLEVCTRMIAEFHQQMPWEFVLDMARQASDEAYHAMLCCDRIQQLGFAVGQFPIDLQLWKVTQGLPLGERLGAHQRLGEWLGTDGAFLNASRAYAANDDVTGRIWEYIAVDEVAHVGYGNKWVRYIGRDAPGVQAIVERAISARRTMGKTVFGPPSLPFHREACRRSGFDEHEIDELERSRGGRS